MTELETIDAEIAELRNKHDAVVGRKCAVYTRIVGYYGDIENPQAGRRKEIDERKMFDVEKSLERIGGAR